MWFPVSCQRTWGKMWEKFLVTLMPLLLLPFPICTGVSPPGQPVHLNCRSPEKETFTCRWEPGSDGGLTTMYHLFYQRENSDETFECPDYQSAGDHSCFFDRTHTFIWVTYNITIVASNSLGRTRSDPLEVDVMDIVYPNAPENLTASVVFLSSEESPYLLMTWEPPHGLDVHSGWITPTYQLRIKQKKENEWEEYISGKQTQFEIYSLPPEALFMVQVQCKIDHGLWSEWSPMVYAEVPNYTRPDKSDWIVVGVFLSFIVLVGTFILTVKRKLCVFCQQTFIELHLPRNIVVCTIGKVTFESSFFSSIKHCVLPPVPVPKIRGFDVQLLKSGRPEDILSAVFQQGFPPTVSCKDQSEYLVVSDSKESMMNSPTEQTRTANLSDYKWQSILHLSEEANWEVDGEQNLERCEDQDYTPESHRPTSTENTSMFNPPSFYADLQSIQNFSDQQQIDASENPVAKHINYIKIRVNSQNNRDEELHMDRTAVNMFCTSTAVGYVDISNVTEEELGENQFNYSKVSGVDTNNVLLLQREIVQPKSPPFGEKENLEEFTSQRSCYLDKTGPTPGEVNTGLKDNGYVDTMPM
ncbi:prolactin receptor b isoform X2 [Osmerus mordax]|uniref:prolactin receptor b isoform X2 n=1 Tax=Osmerus mordax TaxID=8014 RepID=UPI0035100172